MRKIGCLWFFRFSRCLCFEIDQTKTNKFHFRIIFDDDSEFFVEKLIKVLIKISGKLSHLMKCCNLFHWWKKWILNQTDIERRQGNESLSADIFVDVVSWRHFCAATFCKFIWGASRRCHRSGCRDASRCQHCHLMAGSLGWEVCHK